MLATHFLDFHKTDSSPSHPAGTTVMDDLGRIWKYVQASATVAQGNVLMLNSGTGVILDADVDAAAAVDTIRVTATGDFATTTLVNPHYTTANGHKYWLWINAGAAQGQGGIITNRVSDDAVDVYWVNSNDGKIATALTTSSDYIVINDTRVALTTGATTTPVGVAQTAVTDEYWFWMLVWGRGVVLLDTDDNAITSDDQILIPSASTAGYAQGSTGTLAAADVGAQIGRSFVDQDADGLVLVDVTTWLNRPYSANAMWIPNDVTFAYPRRF